MPVLGRETENVALSSVYNQKGFNVISAAVTATAALEWCAKQGENDTLKLGSHACVRWLMASLARGRPGREKAVRPLSEQ